MPRRYALSVLGKYREKGLVLYEIDWNEAWKEKQAVRRRPDCASHWDKRAPSFVPSKTSAYAEEFLRLAGIQEGESVLDMGCGSGSLAIPLARAGHHVCAVDFSRQMLALLEEHAADEKLADINTVLASWSDHWDEKGVEVADVALASRSIAVADLGAALEKIDAHARRRICLTITTGESPKSDAVIMQALGRLSSTYTDYVYCMNILFQMGKFPELRYIDSWKDMTYSSLEAAREDVEGTLGDITDVERGLLEKFYENHLVSFQEEGETRWKKDYRQLVRWAFISWNK